MTVERRYFVPCPVCQGTGTVRGNDCLECVASGMISAEAARMLRRLRATTWGKEPLSDPARFSRYREK